MMIRMLFICAAVGIYLPSRGRHSPADRVMAALASPSRRHAPRLCLLLVLQAAIAFDVEGGRPTAFPAQRPPAPTLGGSPQLAQEGARPAVQTKVTRWVRQYQSFIAATAKVSRGISMAMGLWLILGTPMVLIKSGFTLRAGDALMSIYLASFGLLMFLVEIPLKMLQSFLQSYAFFMYTKWGRSYFLVLAAATAWTLDKVGVMTKALLVFSASLSVYVMFSSTGRFSNADDQAHQMMQRLRDEAKGKAGQAQQMTGLFGGMASRMFGSSDDRAAATSGSQLDADSGASWPSGGGPGA